jgi:hypothetical protein
MNMHFILKRMLAIILPAHSAVRQVFGVHQGLVVDLAMLFAS